MRADRRAAFAAVTAVAGAVVLLGGALTASVGAADPGSLPATAATTAPTTETETAGPSQTADPSQTTAPTGSTDPTVTAPVTATVTSTVPPTGTSTPTATAGTAVEVDDAVLRWGINNESNNRAYAPQTFNFFSAGRVPDPGRGGTTLRERDWRAEAGSVQVQKWTGSAWRRATWSGLSTDSSGQPLGSPVAGTFSNHNLVFGDGTGTVDVAAGTAQLTWRGDATVLYYSGMSLFYVSDPTLTVADGSGRLTATLGGFASSVDDPDAWEPVPAEEVTLAVLPEVSLRGQGFSADPAYRGVAAPAGLPQVTAGEDWGAFPPSFVRYLDRLGAAAFWFSSGALTDSFKVPLPLTASWGSGAGVATPTPTLSTTPTTLHQPTPTPEAPLAGPAQPPATDAAVPVPAPDGAATAAAPALLVARTGGPVPQPPAALASATTTSAVSPAWWIGSALLLAAGLLLLVPGGSRPRPSR